MSSANRARKVGRKRPSPTRLPSSPPWIGRWMSRRVRSPYQAQSHGSRNVLVLKARVRCLLCSMLFTLGPVPVSSSGAHCLPPRPATGRVVEVGGWSLASVREGRSDGQPNSFHAETVPVVSRQAILPWQGQRPCSPRDTVTLSPLPQDQPLPDAAREFAGVDGGLRLLLLEHVLGVLVELERLLPPLLLHQQDHQARQRVFVGRVLLQGGEEQLLGQAHALVFEVELDQLEEDAVPRAVDRVPPWLRPLGIQVVLEKLAPGEGIRLLQQGKRVLPLALGPQRLRHE